MTNEEYAWREGFDRRMEVDQFGMGAFSAGELHPPYNEKQHSELFHAWLEGWEDAEASLRAKQWSAKR